MVGIGTGEHEQPDEWAVSLSHHIHSTAVSVMYDGSRVLFLSRFGLQINVSTTHSFAEFSFVMWTFEL
jgi:hypothetical protein